MISRPPLPKTQSVKPDLLPIPHARRALVGAGTLLLCAGALCVGVLCVGGCNYLGAILTKVTGDPKAPAEYVPTREDMLVLIEDSQNPDLLGTLGDRMMTDVADTLKDHKIDQLIDPAKLITFRAEHLDQYRRMSVLALAHHFKARQVLYADIVSFNVTAPIGSETAKGTITAHVKIVDAQTGETRWPQDAGPQIITVQSPTLPVKGSDNLEPLNDYVVDRLSKQIAELFYEHTISDESEEEKN